MTDPLLRASSESPWWRGIRAPLKATVFIGALVVGVLAQAGRVSKGEGDWAFFALVFLFGVHLVHDVRRGRTQIPSRGGDDPRYDYVRSADPIGFWILIALQGAVAAAIAVGAIGDLLGLWKFWD